MLYAAFRQGIETHRNSFNTLQNGAEVDDLLAEDVKAKEARGRQRSTTARESALLIPPSAKRVKDNSRPKARLVAELMIPENLCQSPTIPTASQLPELPSPLDSQRRLKWKKPRGDSERHSMHVRETTEAEDNLPPVSRQPIAPINGASRVRLHI